MTVDSGYEDVGDCSATAVEERCRRLEMLNEELLKAKQRKDQFIAVLSHELRNLLAPVGYSVELIRMSPDNLSSIQECCSIADRQLRQMARLVDDLLDVSKIARGSLELRLERVRLAEVVDGAVEISKPRMAERMQRLILDSDGNRLLVNADRVRLTHVLANLLLNASKFSPRETEIELKILEEAGYATISIKDRGVGLSSNDLGRIFEMYSQLNSPTDGTPAGLGIGLGLAKAIVEQHSGSITVRSEGPGCGSEFTVRLPCATAS